MNQISFQNNQISYSGNKKQSNKISTTLYTFYNFLLLSLWYQLKKFTNIYFIVTAVLTIIPILSSLDPLAAFAPVSFVLLFSMSFDLYEDLVRWNSDRKINNEEVEVIRNNQLIKVKSKQIKIGDLLLMEGNSRVMADCVLLTYRGAPAYAYIDMSSLDGEKTLKPKISILPKNIGTDVFLEDQANNQNTYIKEFIINYQENSSDLTSFDGTCRYITTGETEGRDIRLDINNFLPRSSIIKNSIGVVGLVIYVGHNTKIMQNTQKRIYKESRVEKRMNLYIFVVVVILVALLLFLSTYSTIQRAQIDSFEKLFFKDKSDSLEADLTAQFFIKFFSYIVLMNTILPISLIITLQLVRLTQKFSFYLDKRFKDSITKEGCDVKSANINEELGQIEYVLSDKTGTLTQNKMVTKYFQIGDSTMSVDSEQTKINRMPFVPFRLESQDKKSSFRVDRYEDLELLFFLIVNCCHDCFSVSKDNDGENGEYELLMDHIAFEGPSPDEVALLKASKNNCGYLHKGSDTKHSIIYTKRNEHIIVDKYFTFQFDSNRKMMSTIIKYKEKYLMLVKGADTSIEERLANHPTAHFKTCMYNFDVEGLRTMLFAVKLLSKQEVDVFLEKLKDFEMNSDNVGIDRIKKEIEFGLTLVGGSAIEDKLQDGLKESIERFRDANIRIWVITGDKGATATNIAFNSNIFKREEPVTRFKETDIDNLYELARNSLRSLEGEYNLLIEGKVLTMAINDTINKQRFIDYILSFNSVVFYRTNPNQKVDIVRLLKSRDKVVLAVGDGANDVNMIQEANVGVGIKGKEGKQAENASDFAIPRFQFLLPLIFQHGRLSYYRNTQLILFFYYKNFLFTIPQFLFAFNNYHSQLPFYNSFYIGAFNLIFTSFHVPARGVTDVDINNKASYYVSGYVIEAHIYFYGKLSKLFNIKKFSFWLITATLEATLVYYYLFIFYNDIVYFKNYEASYDFLTILFFSFVIYYVLVKICYLTRSFTLLNVAGILLGVILYIVYVKATNNNRRFGYEKGIAITFDILAFNISLFFLIFGVFMFTLTYYSIKQEFFPSVKDKIRMLNKQIDTTELKFMLKRWRSHELARTWYNSLFN